MAITTNRALGAKLGSGADGVVYRDAFDPRRVVKVFNNPTQEDIDRLYAALALGVPSVVPGTRARLAWPTDVQLNAAGDVCGFAMPVAAGADPAILASAMDRGERRTRTRVPDFQTRLQHAAAAAAVVGHYHDHEVIIGDINTRNLMASRDGWLTGIDCDSVQFRGLDGRWHRNDRHTPEFLAPELIGVDLSRTPRTAEHDRFALAVLIFMVLHDGWHPFEGAPRSSGAISLVTSADYGQLRFSRHCPALEPPRRRPPREVLPEKLAALLETTFAAGTDGEKRVSAWELHDAATRALGELDLCDGAVQHHYPRGRPFCPWCKRGRRLPVIRPRARRPAAASRRPSDLREPASRPPSVARRFVSVLLMIAVVAIALGLTGGYDALGKSLPALAPIDCLSAYSAPR